jgi:hypothetical protein
MMKQTSKSILALIKLEPTKMNLSPLKILKKEKKNQKIKFISYIGYIQLCTNHTVTHHCRRCWHSRRRLLVLLVLPVDLVDELPLLLACKWAPVADEHV